VPHDDDATPEGAPPGPPERPSPAAGVLARHGPALLAAAGGLLALAALAGGAILDPFDAGWIYQRDLGSAQVGWTFFRTAPWAFPLGANPLYPYGIGSTIGYADAIPIVAVLLKPFAGLLPADFQYFGPWLGLCFAAQGFAGAKLTALVTPSRPAHALGGLLFAGSPVLAHRLADPATGHAALCAHALVLAFLWMALAPLGPGGARRRLAAALGTLLLATGVHPYFVAMGAALALALVVRLALVDRRLRPAMALAWTAGIGAVMAGGLWVFGYLSGGVRTREPGFGFFSADLLALVNPMGWSRLWGGLPAGRGQYEGFGYAGAGALLLLALALAGAPWWARRREAGAGPRRAAPVLLAALALFAFALSDWITLAGRPVLHLAVLPARLPFLCETFRSSGRFVWPLHELAILGAVAGAAALARQRPAPLAALLAVAAALQFAELRPTAPARLAAGGGLPVHAPAWQLARGHYRHLSRYPALLIGGGNMTAPEPEGCGRTPWSWEPWIPPADLAYRLGLTYDAGYLARLDPARAAATCAATRQAVRTGRLDAETIYLVHQGERAWFAAAGAACGALDGFTVCVAGDRADPFARALAANR